MAAGFALPVGLSCENKKKMEFKISLAEWSLHRMLFSGELDHLEFCQIAREQFDLDAVEYVNSFFFDKAEDSDYLKEMKNRANDHGVSSLLIMCDNEGDLGDPNPGWGWQGQEAQEAIPKERCQEARAFHHV